MRTWGGENFYNRFRRGSGRQDAFVELFVERDDVWQAVGRHAPAAGGADGTRFFGVVGEVANGFGEPRGVANRHGDSAAAGEKVTDAACVGAHDRDFHAEGLHDATGKAFALGGEGGARRRAEKRRDVPTIAEEVNRFAEAKLSDLSFDFGTMRSFAHKRHVDVGTVEACNGLNNVAMAFFEHQLGDHSDEFVVW